VSERAGNGWAELEAALDSCADRMTPAERSIAAYLRENKATIAYETGARMAESIGVSEMTIIRFVRGLGYKNLRDMKNHIRPRSVDAEALDDVRERFTSQTSDIGQLTDSLQLELRAIQRAYEAASHPRWARIVKTVATRQNVHVVGFQATRGLAVDFANRLKYVRPGVRFAEGSAGVYSEILESAPSKSVLVQVDTASYARKGILLARKAKELNIPLIIVTDRYSHWAREFTEDLIEMNTYVGTFWDSTASISVVLNLLIHSVAARLGDKAKSRFNWMVGLGEHFNEFDAAASRHVEAARNKPRGKE
jgi:DNA-binding MurR/RpiR family transcriptional regulator